MCVLVLLGAAVGFRRSRSAERRFWLFIAVTATFILGSQVYSALYVALVDRSGPPVPSISNAFDLAAMATFVALLVTMTRFRHASRAARVRYALDAVAVGLVGVAVLYSWVIGPWFAALAAAAGLEGPDVWVKVLNSVYPIVGATILVGTLRNLIGTRFVRWESWERLVGGGMAFFAAGLVGYPVSYADSVWGFASPWAAAVVEVTWLAGLYLVFAGAVFRHTERDAPWRLGPLPVMEPARGWVPSVVMPAIEILAIPAFGIAAYGAVDPGQRFLSALAVAALTVLLAARTALTIVDNGALFSRSVTDSLTGLFNHRHFHERLRAEISAAGRYGAAVSVIVLDLDDFSRVNSVGGHGAGDRALVQVARCVERGVRGRDAVCRIGGDEIGIVLTDTDSGTAVIAAERVLAEIRTVTGPDGRALTASAGVASYPSHSLDRDELVRRADGAAYWAKYHGKNRAVLYDPAVVLSLDADERIRNLQEQAHLDSVRALAAAVDARDGDTRNHSHNVATLAALLAREVGLDERNVVLLELAGTLHDVGKIGLPDSILRKSGPLTDEEWAYVREHPALGQHILASTRLVEILPWVRHHHERWDGRGYPDGLAGEDIPLEARLLALCDAFDAMTLDRPYRSAMSREAALQEIDLNLGTQFDPSLGETFIHGAGRHWRAVQ